MVVKGVEFINEETVTIFVVMFRSYKDNITRFFKNAVEYHMLCFYYSSDIEDNYK